MIVIVGEILNYRYKHYNKIAGSPFHIAYHFAATGLPVYFLTRIGNDSEGERIIGRLQQSVIDTSSIQVDEESDTCVVQLRDESIIHNESELPPHCAFDNISYNDDIRKKVKKDLDALYFSSLLFRTEHGLDMMNRILIDSDDRALRVCDLSFNHHTKNVAEIIKGSLSYSNIVKIGSNKLNSLMQILDASGSPESFIEQLTRDYAIDWFIVSDRESRIDLFTSDNYIGFNYGSAGEYGSKSTDSFGADDAFLAIFIIGLIDSWEMNTILDLAYEFSREIANIKGAIPMNNDFYKTRLSNLNKD